MLLRAIISPTDQNLVLYTVQIRNSIYVCMYMYACVNRKKLIKNNRLTTGVVRFYTDTCY